MLLCVLQCVIVCCSVLQRVAECYSWRMYFGTDAPGIVETFSKVSSTFLVFEFYLSITSTLQHIATHCNAPINSFNRRLNVTQIGLFFARAWYVAQVSLWRPYEFVTVSSWNSYDFVTFACAWYVRHIFTLLSDILMRHMSVLDIHVSSWHICYYICVLTCWPAHVFTLLPHIPQYMYSHVVSVHWQNICIHMYSVNTYILAGQNILWNISIYCGILVRNTCEYMCRYILWNISYLIFHNICHKLMRM